LEEARIHEIKGYGGNISTSSPWMYEFRRRAAAGKKFSVWAFYPRVLASSRATKCSGAELAVNASCDPETKLTPILV
jgi:hypothetical protein